VTIEEIVEPESAARPPTGPRQGALPYAVLFEADPDAHFVAEVGGRLVDVNRAACELLGYARDELLLLGLLDLAADPEATDEQRRRAIADGHWQGELELRRKDGGVVPVELHVRLVEVDGATLYLGSARDVTQRRKLARAQREFISLVGHELRNPIASLKGYAQLMQRRAIYSREAVETIVRQTNRLNRLVGDLLDASRLEAGRLELRRTEVDLVGRLRGVVEAMRELTDKHQIEFDAPEWPVVGWWDRDRLEQVMDNLVGNAIKYSPDGGRIVVRIEDRGHEVLISVADQGSGIAPEALPYLFERFYRAPDAVDGPARGIGLGLYVCKGLVEAMGGRIWVDSEPAHGSTFTFTLPRTDPPP
jgi:two-component system phosphate regulon sensor histidine kinase PhoR